MAIYRVHAFQEEFELDDDCEVVSAELSYQGTAPTKSSRNYALVRVPDDKEYTCGAETQSGECQRSVDGPDERCWDHEDDA